MLYHLNMGSNLGEPLRNITGAIGLLGRRLPCVITAVSKPFSSKPWGYSSPNDFVNMGINIDTPLGPHALLDELQAIERLISPASHRNDDGSYRDRIIDIDIIAARDTHARDTHAQDTAAQDTAAPYSAMLRLDSATLTLPHPHAAVRDFVAIPARELGWEL